MRLAFDTSSPAVSIGLFDELKSDWFATKYHRDEKPQQSKLLLKLIDELLKEKQLQKKDIHSIAVGVGPGSYTGLRVGLTVAKIWSYALAVDLYQFSSKRAVERRQKVEPEAKEPSVAFLRPEDFELVDNVNELSPIYENDHFSS